ncbi:uncharacterized protein LOC117167606 [Belonocnema kinseyi]|uniref:uncharacterized protein LOC117167606 n=1 Tax=Belonocnema kinseyi TaxID=2817044 RepID=UPI00143DEEB1|nr:uncharacterized protein LOC117167606 [Belonocnema kinseyi]
MYFYHAVLLLLSWSCVKSTEDKKLDVILDQIAVDSKREVDKTPHAVLEVVSKNPPSNSTVRSAERVTLHYENSNGFVPLIVSDQRIGKNLVAGDKLTKEIEKKKSESLLENDPFYSPEARFFFNLPHSGANRRSLDSAYRRSDFEILKVDNDTPAVANYQKFYDNVQSFMNKSHDPADIDKKRSENSRSRDRGKKVQNHMEIYGVDSSRDTGDDYYRHRPLNSYNNNQFKSNYDSEKVNNNYHEQDMSGYNLQRNAASKEKLTLSRTNHNLRQLEDEKKLEKSKGILKSTNTNNQSIKNPVADVRPNDYKVNIKFGTQSVRSSVLPSIPHENFSNPSDSRNAQSSNIHVQHSFNHQGTSRHYERSEDSQDFSDETVDYGEVTENPKKLHKNRRRPHTSEFSRKLPKEHRESYSQNNGERKRVNLSRTKQRNRQRNKYNNWDEEGRYQFQGESNGNEDKPLENTGSEVDNINFQSYDSQSTDAWKQVDQNVEVSHSNGYEVDQIEKPKLLFPVNMNLVPLSQFDHQTALGNSQGFDFTNAMIQNFGAGMSIISTAAPFDNTPTQHLTTKNGQSIQNNRQVPDIIVGQSSLRNPVSVFLPQGQKEQNGKTHYIQSTVTPLFTITQNVNPSSHATASSTTTNPVYTSTSTASPVFQQVTLNGNQFLVPQPTLQSLSTMLRNSHSNVQVQSHGLQGQNTVHFQNIPSASTTQNPVTQRYATSGDGQYLATASLSVGNEAQKPNQQKALFQPAQMVPTIYAGLYLNNQNQVQQTPNNFIVARPRDNAQIQKAANDAFMSSVNDLQLQIQRNQLANSLQGVDNIGSTSNKNVNAVNAFAGIPINFYRAQFPIVGTKNVEIVNPNVKPSSADLNIYNPVTPINQYTAMYTTQIPILSATSFVTSRPASTPATAESVHLNNYVDTLTEFGTKIPPVNMFNPINFVPNADLVKSQTILNRKPPQNDILQQNLNLVPILPGGNFFQNSQGAQANLANQPKLHSDLAQYAEQMLKESLKTMYNSHKWNKDRRTPGNISIADTSEIAKLRNELLRYNTLNFDSKLLKDTLDAHQTENKIRTIKPDTNSSKTAFSIEQIEQILKDDFKRHPSDYFGKTDFETERNNLRINNYLTPPKPNSFLSKSPFHDKPVKKRPGSAPPGFKRSRPRKGAFNSKPTAPEASASNNFEFGFDSSRFRQRPHFDHEISDLRPGRHSSHSKFRQKSPGFHNYPTFTTSSPDNEQRTSSKELYDVNHPRFHNLLGLLMKNKRLPVGSSQSFSKNRDRENFAQIIENENLRLEEQFYKDAMQGFQKKSDPTKSYSRKTPIEIFL